MNTTEVLNIQWVDSGLALGMLLSYDYASSRSCIVESEQSSTFSLIYKRTMAYEYTRAKESLSTIAVVKQDVFEHSYIIFEQLKNITKIASNSLGKN